MIAGETIVCFAADPWAGLWRNRHQILTRLARSNTVLYVEPRLYLGATLRRLRDGRLRLADLRRPLAEHYRDGLYIYHDPYYAPFSGRLTGGPLTAVLRRRAMAHTLRRLGCDRPILWLLRPYMADQIGQYDEKLVVYHVTDEYSAFPTVRDRQAFLQEEAALLRRADLVIVTSPGLLASKGRFNPHTYLVPNAVDFEGFQESLGRPPSETSAAARIRQLPRPRIGYAGALNEKVDYGLLAQVARTRPHWQIVLIGELDLYSQPDKVRPLGGPADPDRLPNVHWVGRLPVAELPQAIASLDVCLLPYERNEWTANIDSLKLYEYLACGRPVVSTDIPAARSFGEVVRIGESPDHFIALIEEALAEADPKLAEERRAVAAANTWEHRVARIEALLAEALARRGQVAPAEETGP